MTNDNLDSLCYYQKLGKFINFNDEIMEQLFPENEKVDNIHRKQREEIWKTFEDEILGRKIYKLDPNREIVPHRSTEEEKEEEQKDDDNKI